MAISTSDEALANHPAPTFWSFGRLKYAYISAKLELSADATIALTLSGENEGETARLWDTATGGPVGVSRKIYSLEARRAAMSADGKVVVASTFGKNGGIQVRLWDAVTGNPIGAPIVPPDEVDGLALSRDGTKALILCRNPDEVHSWDSATEKPIGPPIRLLRHISRVALSADGKIALVGGGHERISRLWDTATGKPIGVPLPHQDSVLPVALSPDGRFALTGSNDRTARLWETATGKLIGSPFHHHRSVLSVALSADGKAVLTGDEGDAVRFWRAARFVNDPIRIALWAQVVTGMEVDDSGKVRPLNEAAWHERRARLEKLGGPPEQ